MWARLQRLVKEEKGLTLIELLAVIVILGIIAAIAVPAITGITNNTKQEAHKANAHQIVEAAKQMVAINNSSLKFITDITKEGDITVNSKGEIIKLEDLESANYFPNGIKDPVNPSKNYDSDNSSVIVIKDTNGSFQYYVTLVADSNGTKYFTKVNELKIDTTAPVKP
ncbi:prepilin-type N-terminal cleavage/methylation domain-containing protein [Brevibacillus fluminis]|uniref:Prepilin-type N-terminal cleavage/methylation domain-containing protein n=2 Tax=Brevibacillus fluminis TaxID=511487 RepID=A0A3M8DRF8_9BACL|nr:prepilin-type N-terminal cleavage/methylation domain-containing protein [Brevibacillus fluminis]